MRTTELRELLGTLEESSAPEPSALFVAKLEADLRTMDQTAEAEVARPRKRRARALAAAAPIAALTAAAAAAAVTLLPSDPHPRQVNTADPGLTVPAPSTELPTTSMPSPPTTNVVVPPWLPPAPAPATTTPPTTAVRHNTTETSALKQAEHATPTVAQPHEPVTTVPPAPTTTAPTSETLTLQCTAGMSAGNGVIFCGWSQSTSPAFAWYKLWREAQGSSLAVVFQSDNSSTTGYYDKGVQSGTNYYYKVDVTDALGNVIGTSNIVAISCC